MKHLILNEKEYKELENGTLFFRNCYDLELVDVFEKNQIKTSLYFNAIEEKFRYDRQEFINFLIHHQDKTLEELIITEDYFEIEESEEPLTLEEWLDTENLFPGEWIIHKVDKEEKDGKILYIISSCRYW